MTLDFSNRPQDEDRQAFEVLLLLPCLRRRDLLIGKTGQAKERGAEAITDVIHPVNGCLLESGIAGLISRFSAARLLP